MRYKGNHFDYNHQTFSQLLSVDGKKIGQPRQTTRNFGGTIADNHLYYVYRPKRESRITTYFCTAGEAIAKGTGAGNVPLRNNLLLFNSPVH